MPSRKRRARRRFRRFRMLFCWIVAIWLLTEARFYVPKRVRPPRDGVPVQMELATTSYCHCRKCCSYRWLFFIPYQKTGWFSFRLKHVGKTASGAMARPGTIAADPTLFPFGTVMHVPGYGYGRVEDTGGAVKGRHIDLYRPNHWLARLWGVRRKTVTVWLPQPSLLEDEVQNAAIPDGKCVDWEGMIE